MIKEMTLKSLRNAYLNGSLTPQSVAEEIRERSSLFSDRNIWIHLLTLEEQRVWLDGLRDKPIEKYPLWGIPFAIKDNIDLAGIPTTSACLEFSYVPEQSAQVVQQLIDAGAIPVGKTNLDQFATGLNGTRSPYGPCRNAFDPDYISGGSSAGSATAVALGFSTFSLGSDTAGSGRVPAGFNNLIGVKPTIGMLSSTGMMPACKSLDCMSIFALTSDDAAAILNIAEGYDERDAYSRPNTFTNSELSYGKRTGKLRISVLAESQLRFFGCTEYEQAYRTTLETLSAEEGIELIEIDFSPFDEAALLLYEGPWVTERYLACQSIIDNQPEAVHPVVRSIIEKGKEITACEVFEAQYRLTHLKTIALQSLKDVDCLLTPTAGRHFTISELLEEPIRHNSELGYYTNFMNLFDMAAVSVPVCITESQKPFGITLSNTKWTDRSLLSIANRLEQLFPTPIGASGQPKPHTSAKEISDLSAVELVVCGAHLEGLPLNWQLVRRGATLVKSTHSAPCYKLFALSGESPMRPGMIRDEEHGAAIEVEVWRMPSSELGGFLDGIPVPLGLGKVELSDGLWYTGFICEASGLLGAQDITAHGGWRAWLSSLS